MEDNTVNDAEVIDLVEVVKCILQKKKLFMKVWIATFILSCLIILPIPRTYTSEITVAPESTEVNAGSLSSIASSFGFNIGNVASSDAFYPDIYPDIMASNEFISHLLTVNVTTLDGSVNTDYYTYLTKHQKKTFYMIPFDWTKRTIRGWLKSKDDIRLSKVADSSKGSGIDPFLLSEMQMAVFEVVKASVTCSVDKKTGIITISVVDQDPLICATLADSARVHLQDFITNYRTSKARVDYEYYKKLTDDAKLDYEKALEEYGAYCDSHFNTVLQSENSKREELENDMSIKLNAYNTMMTQMVASKAKIQECTPAFSVLQSSSVPIKATSPKRMIFIVAMLFLATLGTCVYLSKQFISTQLKNIKK